VAGGGRGSIFNPSFILVAGGEAGQGEGLYSGCPSSSGGVWTRASTRPTSIGRRAILTWMGSHTVLVVQSWGGA
jgi:hypothetical protein